MMGKRRNVYSTELSQLTNVFRIPTGRFVMVYAKIPTKHKSHVTVGPGKSGDKARQYFIIQNRNAKQI
ncbi:hypothetical protein ASF70_01410 [Rhizobium sp. Leaf321]|nr:hypothetical protein ASF70_01410 [Rhizobium sp. Leaf321]